MILWVDVETTGLDPAKHDLLEVGLCLTDDRLHPVAETCVLGYAPVTADYIHPEVIAMHDGNGLWRGCRERGRDLFENEEFLIRWFRAHVGDESVPMGGSTISFDRAWLKAKMPRLEALFHYRNIDVSTLKELNKRFHWMPEWEGDRDIHRALPDIEDTISELKWYLGAFASTQMIKGLPNG